MIATQQFRFCDVCRILDFDTRPKLCSYCQLCDAYICEEDAGAWGRRLRAALKRKLEPGYRGIPNYEEVAISKEQFEQLKREGTL